MNISSVFRQSKWSMKRKLFGYMMMLAALLIVALLSGMILFGQLDSEAKNIYEELDIQMEFLEKTVFTHFDRLAGGAIQLSRDTSSIIEDHLNRSGTPLSHLTGNSSDIAGLQDRLIGPLHQKLLQENCSGAFLMLEATVNDALPNADTSRTGLYLQRSGFYSSDETVVLYRGDSAVSKANGILPHTKWRLEFQTDLIPYYEQMAASNPLPLKEAYLLTDVFTLPGTSDQVMLLIVPIFGSDGTFFGVCGFEISENYFITYHAQPTRLENLACILTTGNTFPMDIDLSLSCGGSNGYYHLPGQLFSSYHLGEGLTCFRANDGSYVGLLNNMSLSPHNSDFTLIVMIPKSDYDRAVSRSTLRSMIMWALILFFAASSCLFFSKRYLVPVLKALEQIKSNDRQNIHSELIEIDDLYSFLHEKDRKQEQVVRALEQRRLAALREKERLRREFESAQERYETVQLEVSRLAYSRSQEVDPDDYKQFLAGIDDLTERERAIFDYYIEGKSVKDLTEIAGIKESTIRFHNRNIYSKLGVNSLKQLLRYAALMQQEQERSENA